MFISVQSKNFLEYCFKCIHQKGSYTCGASLCDLSHSQPCRACGYNKYIGVKGFEEHCKPDEILECNDFEEKTK